MPPSRSSRLRRRSQRYRLTVGRETRAPQSRSGAANDTSISRLVSGTVARRNASSDSSSRCSIVASVDQVEVALELGLGAQPAELLELPLQREGYPLHGDRATLVGGQERGPERRVVDGAAGHPELPGQEVQVQLGRWRAGREGAGPDQPALRLVGRLEIDRDRDPAQERIVDVALQVG